MPEVLTSSQRLAGHLLGRPLGDYVTEKRAQERPRWSWQDIADQLADDTEGEVAVSAESLRQWYGAEAVAS